MAKQSWIYITVHPNKKVRIDRSDLARVSEHSWRIVKGSTGRIRVVTSIRKKNQVRQVTLGSFLMKPPKGKQVYPRRFNVELDYRKDNLIVCTLKERQRLLPKNRKNRASKYRGVSFNKNEGRWVARIKKHGRSIYLGLFKTEDAAALAYNKSARELFGSIAYQNPVGRKFTKRD